jgi:hypothetical protein
MTALGTLVMDEMIIPVVAVKLERERVWVVGRLKGPIPEGRFAARDIRIHGSDGSLVCQGVQRVGWPRCYEGDVIDATFEMEISGRVFYPTGDGDTKVRRR